LFALTFAHRDCCAAILRRADADIVGLTGLVLALTRAAGFDPCRTFAHLAFVPEPYASALRRHDGSPVELPLREAPEPFRPTKALFHTSILAACGSDRRYRSHALIPGSKSTSWKSALACRTRSQTPLKKLEAVGHVFGTTDPDEGVGSCSYRTGHNAH
jgi:hypothetical protein